MNGVGYYKLVKGTLLDKWKADNLPWPTDKGNLKAAIKLFASIASDAEDREFSAKPISSDTDDVAAKIKAIVLEKAYWFRQLCQTGFPFAQFEGLGLLTAMEYSLKNPYKSLLYHFIRLDKSWLTEGVLDLQFGTALQYLHINEIADCCVHLKKDYLTGGDLSAGYYLLWLIKQTAGCNYEIPEKENFTRTTVGEVLSNFMSAGSVKNSPNFIEILHYQKTRLDPCLYQRFLDSNSKLQFLNFMAVELERIAMHKWPNKPYVITNFFESLTSDSKPIFAQRFAKSEDLKTAEIGVHFLAAFEAKSLGEATSHYYALKQLLPHFNESHVAFIFRHPFIKFTKNHPKYDPEFTKVLSFNESRDVFVHGTIMAGVYHSGVIDPYLLGFDMDTEKLVWGIPLTSSRSQEYRLQDMGKYISLQFMGEKNVRLINPQTGEFEISFELTEKKSPLDEFHITSEGFIYQVLNDFRNANLIGGKIIDKQFVPSFECTKPRGSFISLSTHCGFEDYVFGKQLVLIGPDGNKKILPGCMGAIAHEDKLYAIEKDPNNQNRCLLTIRTLKQNAEVVSEVEQSISLSVQKATFGKLCHNGKIVLFADKYSDLTPIFFDLKTGNLVYSKHKIESYGKKFINPDLAEVWTWDEISKEVWKVSVDGATLMGRLERGRGVFFAHVDKHNQLYFVDI